MEMVAEHVPVRSAQLFDAICVVMIGPFNSVAAVVAAIHMSCQRTQTDATSTIYRGPPDYSVEPDKYVRTNSVVTGSSNVFSACCDASR